MSPTRHANACVSGAENGGRIKTTELDIFIYYLLPLKVPTTVKPIEILQKSVSALQQDKRLTK